MIKLPFRDDSGNPIDARFEVESRELILHSRGGASDSPNARNTQYAVALQLLLQRIRGSDLTLAGVWVDSSRVRQLPIEQRQIYFPEDAEASPQALASRFSTRMISIGRASNTRSGGGNSTKRLRFSFAGSPSDERIARVAGWGRTGATEYHDRQLPSTTFDPVRENHVWRAVQQLAVQRVKHAFGESTDYDVIVDDELRLPPKAVFGLAASEALGFQVQPWQFRGGLDTRCFNTIISAGYRIMPKGEDVPPNSVPVDPEVRVWIEGSQDLVTHLRRERSSGLAPAKKRAFKDEFGRLFCERCNMEPDTAYGPEIGEACIEVHHRLPLHSVPGTRETRLEDLMCVCANCHRVIHYELRKTLREQRDTP